jgi:hypothetical protein
LFDTLVANDNIVEFFADLDCATDTLNRAEGWCAPAKLLQRPINVVIQIRIPPGTSSSSSTTDGDDSTSSYTKVVKDL